MDETSRTTLGRFAVCAGLIFVFAGLLGTEVPARAAELPSAYNAELKAAKKVQFGETFALSVCGGGSIVTGCKPGTLKIRIDSIKYEPPPSGESPLNPWFRLSMKVQNLTNQQTGALPRIRCSRLPDPGGWGASGDINPSAFPARSQMVGWYTVSFPTPAGSEVAVNPTQCKDPVLWMYPSSPWIGSKKGLKYPTQAYIPLRQTLLAELQKAAEGSATQADASTNPTGSPIPTSSPSAAPLSTAEPTDVPEFEVDPSTLMSTVRWPEVVSGPQVVKVEIFGPAQMEGLLILGSSFTRQFGGKRNTTWERTLMPDAYGMMNDNVFVNVSRDSRVWPVPNARPLPKGNMGCRIFVNGQLVSEFSVTYAWKANSKVNLARCELSD